MSDEINQTLSCIDENENPEPVKKNCFGSLSLPTKVAIIVGSFLLLSAIITAIIIISRPKNSSNPSNVQYSVDNTSLPEASNSETSLVDENLPKVTILTQGKSNCKSTALAQSINIIMGTDKYTSADLGGDSCSNVNGQKYRGSNGKDYKATYKTDSYQGSAKEQKDTIDNCLSHGLPIVVAVHKTGSGTKHHWVTFLRKSGSSYDIIDPVGGTQKTLDELGYDFGLADSSPYHYGFISFTESS